MPFQKGKPKTGGRKKEVKNKRTRVREALGVKHWNEMEKFIETKGMQKASEELMRLKGKEFLTAFNSLSEFFKPKLHRTEHAGRVIAENYNVDLTPEEMKKINQTLENDC